jgi:hypothetical protein
MSAEIQGGWELIYYTIFRILKTKMAARRSYFSFLTKNQGMPMVAVGW